ncbi:MAG: class I tRNA ligase family protein [Angustibacter sp.]
MIDVGGLLGRIRQASPVDPAYFFFAGYPTPNGELHLGHVGGPYLRSDAAARCLELHGARVCCATASDAWETGVLLAAVTSGEEPRVVATRHHDRAHRALAGLSLRQEVFLNPQTDEVLPGYAAHCRDVTAALARTDRIRVRTERLLPGRSPGPPWAVAAFVSGACEHCGAQGSGNVCESCGCWMSPEHLDVPWGGAEGTRRPVRSAFVVAGEAFSATGIAGRCDDPRLGALVDRYRREQHGLIRLSYPLGWGVPWSTAVEDGLPPLPVEDGLPPLPAETVHTSYLTGKYASTRLLGEHARQRLGRDPFAPGSGITTVATGGIDSALGWLALTALAGRGVDFEPFDAYVVNAFMLLDGQKFSTSRRHVIRVNDALDASLSPDALRLALARVGPGRVETDLGIDDVAETSAQDVGLLTVAVAPATPGSRPDTVDESARDLLGELLHRQQTALQVPDVDLPAAAEALVAWASAVRAGTGRGCPRSARRGLALLALPLLPGWAGAVWRSAGRCGDDRLDALVGGAAWDGSQAPAMLAPVPATVLEELRVRGQEG